MSNSRLNIVLISLLLAALLTAAHLVAVKAEVRPTKTPRNTLIRVAIIDTGFKHYEFDTPLKLCTSGHFDFVKKLQEVNATLPHGTRVANIIANQLKDVQYCALIYQVYGPKGVALNDVTLAINKAVANKADVINISLSGDHPDLLEQQALQDAVNAGVKVFIAADNHGINLDKDCEIYPVCYKLNGVDIVGALDPNTGGLADYTNYGSIVNDYYDGSSEWHGVRDYGTSYAAPRALSRYVLELSRFRQLEKNQ